MHDNFLERVKTGFTQDLITQWINTFISEGLDALKNSIAKIPAYKDDPNEIEEVASYVESLAQNNSVSTGNGDANPNMAAVRG
jgi:hypothetical protein